MENGSDAARKFLNASRIMPPRSRNPLHRPTVAAVSLPAVTTCFTRQFDKSVFPAHASDNLAHHMTKHHTQSLSEITTARQKNRHTRENNVWHACCMNR